FGLTSWDRKSRPQGLAFEEFIKLTQGLDLDDISVPAGDVGIVIPEEWARTRHDFARFGLTGPEIVPYVSVREGGAVNGQEPAPYTGNQWVMSSALAAFVLAHRAGLKPDLPREAADWTSYPLLLLPSPLTAADPIFVHMHTDFWSRAADYVSRGGVLYASLAANAAVPEMASLFGARMTDSVPVTAVTLRLVKPFGDLQPGETFHFAVPGNEARFWGTGLEVHGGEVIAR